MVDVNTQNKTISVIVSSSGVSSNVNASGDTTLYYSNKAKEWATSNRIVDGVDYSSKYYAGKANQSALNAQSFAQSAQDSYNNFQDSVTDSLNTIDNKVQEATENIEIQKQDVITEIEDLSEQDQNKIVDLSIDTRANVDLSNLSEQGQAKFDEKANVADVLNKSDKSEVSGWGMPSGKYIDLTLGASGTRYTAPANGWFALRKTASANGQYLYVGGKCSSSIPYGLLGGGSFVYVPVSKGDTVDITYNLGGATTYFRFIYAQGEVA